MVMYIVDPESLLTIMAAGSKTPSYSKSKNPTVTATGVTIVGGLTSGGEVVIDGVTGGRPPKPRHVEDLYGQGQNNQRTKSATLRTIRLRVANDRLKLLDITISIPTERLSFTFHDYGLQ